MAEYKAIKGFNIQTFSSDPSNLQLGEMWYNSSLGKVRVTKLGAGAWSTGNNYNASVNSPGGTGSQTAGLGYGGGGAYTSTGEYDGTTWTGGGTGNVNRYQLNNMVGTQTAAMVCGGRGGGGPNPILDSSENYDGATWTASGDMNIAKTGICGIGTQTAGFIVGGKQSPPINEFYNGASFTASADLNTLRGDGGDAGTQTAAVYMGGEPGPMVVTEDWNGTSWTEVATLNSGRYGAASWGTANSAIFAQGYPVVPLTESWDGTSWTELADSPTGKSAVGSSGGPAGTHDAGVQFAGSPGNTNECFEWTVPPPSAGDVTTS